MSTARPAAIVRQLEQSVRPGEPAGDRDLLDRFAHRRDQAAFALLVRRHGPMVLSVCRRVTAHPQDAEDAFQAAFLVLAKKAAAVRNPELLGNWLYGVAVRVAGKARRSAARRRVREVQVSAMPDPSTTPTEPTSDLGLVLHEELAGLPACYREPIVLCDLRGTSRADAAKALGIPEGTVSSRLASGRKKLADRLTRRGVALAAAAVPAALAAPAPAAVPDSLVAKTCGLVSDWAAGSAVPLPVARLAEGGFSVRKLMLIGVFTTALVAGSAVLAAGTDDPPNPPAPRIPGTVPVRLETAAPAPDPGGKATGLTTSPRLRVAIDLPLIPQAYQAFWSPDGKSLAVRGERYSDRATPDGKGVERVFARNIVLVVPNVFEPKPEPVVVDLERAGRLIGFTPDSKQVITELREYNLVSGFHKLQFWEVAPAANVPGLGAAAGGPGPAPGVAPPGLGAPAGPRQELKLVRTVDLDPDATYDYAFAPDGKTFRTVYREMSRAARNGIPVFTRLEVREVSAETGRTLRMLARVDGEHLTYALAANGKRLAVAGAVAAAADELPKEKLTVWDVDAGKKSWVYDLPPEKEQPDDGGGPREWNSGRMEASRPAIQFSPDGRRIACFRDFRPTVVMDADKGDPLPVPEQGEHLIATPQFTGDGRVLVASGSKAIEEHRVVGFDRGGGPGQFGGGAFIGGGAGAKAKKGGGPQPRTQVSYTYGNYLGVWDAATGKRLKSWDHATGSRGSSPHVAAHPTRPVVAFLEANGSGGVRLGLWDFAADADRK
jgi:RNA polymerase sigma factor (sigma-70 family)